MSTTALSTSDPMAFLRQLDLVALASALPLFLLAGFPLLGYATAAVCWLVQRAVKALVERRAAAAEHARTATALIAGGMLVRPWLVALTILPVGVRDNDAGLAAAVLVLVLFTVHLTVSLFLRALDDKPRPAR